MCENDKSLSFEIPHTHKDIFSRDTPMIIVTISKEYLLAIILSSCHNAVMPNNINKEQLNDLVRSNFLRQCIWSINSRYGWERRQYRTRKKKSITHKRRKLASTINQWPRDTSKLRKRSGCEQNRAERSGATLRYASTDAMDQSIIDRMPRR